MNLLFTLFAMYSTQHWVHIFYCENWRKSSKDIFVTLWKGENCIENCEVEIGNSIVRIQQNWKCSHLHFILLCKALCTVKRVTLKSWLGDNRVPHCFQYLNTYNCKSNPYTFTVSITHCLPLFDTIAMSKANRGIRLIKTCLGTTRYVGVS